MNGVWASLGAGVGRWGRGRAPRARWTAAPCPPGVRRGGAARAGLLVGRAGGGGIDDVIEGKVDGHVPERGGWWGWCGVYKEV